MRQIFILSPAKTAGERARLIYSPHARFDLARRLREGEQVPLSEIFSFLSGLYFRGKATYARAFARPPRAFPGVLVITSHRGLLPMDVLVTLAEVKEFSEVPIDAKEVRYLKPLLRDSKLLAGSVGAECQFVFLGSIGTSRYVDPLLQIFSDRLMFPSDFVGRGDMSRGGLLLRAAAENRELNYVPCFGAVRHGKRPQKLPPRSWGYKITEGKTLPCFQDSSKGVPSIPS